MCSLECTATVVGADNGLAERRLMQSLLDHTQGVPPFERLLGRLQRFMIGQAERAARLQCRCVPTGNEDAALRIMSGMRSPQNIKPGFSSMAVR
jgi:hypothetical protein